MVQTQEAAARITSFLIPMPGLLLLGITIGLSRASNFLLVQAMRGTRYVLIVMRTLQSLIVPMTISLLLEHKSVLPLSPFFLLMAGNSCKKAPPKPLRGVQVMFRRYILS